MKKYMIFMGALALAACNNGSSHHTGAGDIIPQPVAPAIDMPANVQAWNSPAGSAQAIANSTDVFTFTIDNGGNIAKIVHDNKTYNRTGDTNEYVYKETNKTEKINLATLGKQAGLSYADFGYAMETELEPDSTERDFYVFAGGDALKEIKNPNIQNATYTGTAVAYVESEMPGKVVNKITQTNDASLVFDNTGNHTLTMKFSKAANPWYDVIVKNGTNISLSGGANLGQDFMVTDAMLKSLKDAYFSQQYFGESGDPSEVVYRVGFEAKDRTTGREIEFDGAFGGKRQ